MEQKYLTGVVAKSVIDAEEGIYEAVITTSAMDRQGEIVIATGMRADDYMKNPIVLFAHDYEEPPVAKTLELSVREDAVVARFQFPEEGTSARADEIHRLWDGGFLNAVSIGFIPLRWAEKAATPTVAEWELLEFSIVPVPANQEALRLMLEEAQAERKEGRALSAKNHALVRECVDSLTELLNASDGKMESGDSEPEGESELEKALTYLYLTT